MRKGLGFHNRHSAGVFNPASLFAGGTVQGAWYDPSDLTTLFQDSAGTTPVTAVEQPVGLMLDKSKGSPLAVGAHRYWRYIVGGSINQHHPRVSRIVLSTATASTNIVVFTADNCADQGTIPTLGATYAYDFGSATAIISASAYSTFNGSRAALYQVEYSDDNTNWFSAFQGNMSATTCGLFAGSVFAYNGNHAYQSINTSRPTLRARYNLLTYSEQFDNAAWTSSGTLTVTPNDTVAPDGTTTADKFDITVLNVSEAGRAQTFTCAAIQYKISWYVKPNTITGARIGMFDGGAFGTRDFTFATKTFGNPRGTLTVGSTSYEELANGWYRLTITITAGAASASANTGVFATSTGSGWFWGGQITQPAVFPSNTYQRVGAATDYATGAAFPPYLFFDGIDDSMLTNSVDFSGTDKMLVVAGVTKNSDAAAGMLMELSATVNLNNGTFYYADPNAPTTTEYAIRGSTGANILSTYNGGSAPITRVTSAAFDLSANTRQSALALRQNGVVVGSTGAITPAGNNFGNYPLYIGRRNNASLPFNGQIYSLIIAGQSYSSGQISSTESWVAAKTPLGTI